MSDNLFGDEPPPEQPAAPKDWTRGFALTRLKGLAAPFAAAKPYVYGAFGYPKERDVATALFDGCLYVTQDDEPTVALIAKTLKVASRRVDFRGVDVKIPAGDCVVWDVGVLPAADDNDVARLLELAWPESAPAQWVEWFEEDPRKHILPGLGFKYVTTLIQAGSEVKGIYVRTRSLQERGVIEPFSACDLVSVGCAVQAFLSAAEQRGIVEELANADWQQHYSSYNKRSSWTAFALRGYQPEDPGFIIKPAEMSALWKKNNAALLGASPDWTSIADRFPITRSVVERLGSGLDRVRFMRLAATSGELTRHADITDRAAGTANGRVMRLHIPILTRTSCIVSSWGIRGRKYEAHFPEGSLCYLDQRRPHAVKNPEQIDRVHLVIDALANETLRSLLEHAEIAFTDQYQSS